MGDEPFIDKKLPAVAYATWLSPDFYAQVLDIFIRYKHGELVKRTQVGYGGFQVPQTMTEALRLATELSERNDALAMENTAQGRRIGSMEPLVRSYKEDVSGEGTIRLRDFNEYWGLAA